MTHFIKKPTYLLFGLCTLLWLHGAMLGPSDDEAYYWVLSREWRWGFAYHPPMILWIQYFIQKVGAILGWSATSPGLMRLGAAICSFGILVFAHRWLCLVLRDEREAFRGLLAGVFAFSGFVLGLWMSVPDLPMFFGMSLLIYAVWAEIVGEPTKQNEVLLVAGYALVLLSKFSGILPAASAFGSLILWRKNLIQHGRWKRLLFLSILSIGLSLLPTLYWNWQEDWRPIAYQLSERHSGGHFRLQQGLRFWLLQFLVAGPVLMLFSARLLWERMRTGRKWPLPREQRYLLVWFFPAFLVFGLQPFFSDYKIHWSLTFWFPLMLFFSTHWSRLSLHRLFKGFWKVSIALTALVFLGCHLPLVGWTEKYVLNQIPNPLHDPSNDLRGWGFLPSFLKSKGLSSQLPVIGSRYQTLSQAAMALGPEFAATRLPVDAREASDWRDLGLSEERRTDWPALIEPVIYVTDQRYAQGPGFRNSFCEDQLVPIQERMGVPGKAISVWLCKPQNPR